MEKSNKSGAMLITRLSKSLALLGMAATVVKTVSAINRLSRRIEFSRKVVVITGGSRGLGLVMARQLADEGAKLVLLARNNEELEAAQQELSDRGADVRVMVCDVTIKENIEDTMQRIIHEMGCIDILINNAGIIQVGPLDSMHAEDFEAAMQSHFWAPFNTSMAVIPHMKEQKFGRIVNISSIGGKVSVPHLLPYNTSKFALAGLSEGLRYELMPDNIYVTTVCPGMMRTGSHVNAKFKGQHELEYAWFSTMNAIPFFSASANSAAKDIIEACRYGDAELIITVPAQMMAKVRALFPEALSDVIGLVSRFLPKNGEHGDEIKSGKESQSQLSPNGLTYFSEKAAKENNEDLATANAGNGNGNGSNGKSRKNNGDDNGANENN